MGCFTERSPSEGGQRESPLVGRGGSSLSEFKVIWETSMHLLPLLHSTLSVACHVADHRQLRKMKDTHRYKPNIRALIHRAPTMCHVWHH